MPGLESPVLAGFTSPRSGVSKGQSFSTSAIQWFHSARDVPLSLNDIMRVLPTVTMTYVKDCKAGVGISGSGLHLSIFLYNNTLQHTWRGSSLTRYAQTFCELLAYQKVKLTVIERRSKRTYFLHEYKGLRNASIAVSIAEPEASSPLSSLTLHRKESDVNVALQNPKQHRASGARRLTGRPSYNASTASVTSQTNNLLSDEPEDITPGETPQPQGEHHHHHHHRHIPLPSPLVSQILDWLHEEKRKRSRRTAAKTSGRVEDSAGRLDSAKTNEDGEISGQRLRRLSESSDGSLALEKLEQIMADNMVIDPSMLRTHLPKRSSTSRKLSRKGSTFGSSDTEYFDGDVIVPSADVILDNSKTLSYSGGVVDTKKESSSTSKRAMKEKEAWVTFKNEIVRLAHTLRLKGWRRVPLDRGGDVDVERLSGALTNAVYVVSPPRNLPEASMDGTKNSSSNVPRRRPQ